MSTQTNLSIADTIPYNKLYNYTICYVYPLKKQNSNLTKTKNNWGNPNP